MQEKEKKKKREPLCSSRFFCFGNNNNDSAAETTATTCEGDESSMRAYIDRIKFAHHKYHKSTIRTFFLLLFLSFIFFLDPYLAPPSPHPPPNLHSFSGEIPSFRRMYHEHNSGEFKPLCGEREIYLFFFSGFPISHSLG